MLFEMQGISKAFPGVQALQNVHFGAAEGEIHALIGENGAGKSTLMKILAGVYYADEGQILLRGKPLQLRGPQDAAEQGIAVVHQEFNLVPDLSVMENIFLGRFPVSSGGFVQFRRLRQQADGLMKTMGRVPLDVPVRSLSVAEMQLVEIAKALSYRPNVLIMDEPTAALNDQEIQALFGILRRLQKDRVTIIYISHRLDEVFAIAQRATVLRDGQVVGTKTTATTTKEEIIRMMVGRSLEQLFPKEQAAIGEELLRVQDLSDGEKLQDISFTLHRGEVLGVAGLMGAGQGQLGRLLFGSGFKAAGRIAVGGREVNLDSPKQAINAGLGWITENRKEEGLVLSQSVMANISLASLAEVAAKAGFFSQRRERALAQKYVSSLDVKTPSLSQPVEFLSGGNQQKVVLAKWLATLPDIVIMSEPTRGVDVGAKVEIYQLINELVAQGRGVLLFSSELPELLGMSDRILVLCEGRIAAVLRTADTSQEEIMHFATGGM